MSNAPRKYISHYSIFNYWKDKAITKDGDVKIEIGYEGCDEKNFDVKESIAVVTDCGEPECWACGKWISNYDYSYIENHTLEQVYDHPEVKSQLEKAHIVPHAIGGDENPCNMFLLCHECHRESPDTKYKKEFFRWVYKTRKRGPLFQHIFITAAKELKERGVPAFCLMVDDSKLNDNIGSHGGMIVSETYKAAYLGAAEERWSKIKDALRTAADENTVNYIESALVNHCYDSAMSILSDQTEFVEHLKEMKA